MPTKIKPDFQANDRSYPESSQIAEEMMNRTGERFNHQQRLARMVML